MVTQALRQGSPEVAPGAEAAPAALWEAKMVCLQLGRGQRSTGQNSYGVAGSGGNNAVRNLGSQLAAAQQGGSAQGSSLGP